MSTRKEQIQQKAIEILKGNTQGIRYSQLVNAIKETFPEIPINTIHGAVWNLDIIIPEEVYKADRGLFRHTSFREASLVSEKGEITTIPSSQTDEEDFYQPFAEYLKNELEEVTKAIPLGKNFFRDKWGTPDVIGINKPKDSDIIRFIPEIVSAEIKTDTNGLITAFGQACSYKIFSNKVYIVIPKNSNEEDKSRIESLCLIFGIGLILFDNQNKQDPHFEIRVRTLKHEPDMYYANKYLKIIENKFE